MNGYVEGLLCQGGRNDAEFAERTKQVEMLIKDPKKQTRVLKTINYRTDPTNQSLDLGEFLDIRKVQQTAREYRQSNLENLRERPDALAELDKFISRKLPARIKRDPMKVESSQPARQQ